MGMETPMKQCLPDTAVLNLIWIHRDSGGMQRAHTGLSHCWERKWIGACIPNPDTITNLQSMQRNKCLTKGVSLDIETTHKGAPCPAEVNPVVFSEVFFLLIICWLFILEVFLFCFVLFFKPYLSFPSLQFCVCISREVYVFLMLFPFYLGFLYVLLYSGWLVGLLLVYMFSKERKRKHGIIRVRRWKLSMRGWGRGNSDQNILYKWIFSILKKRKEEKQANIQKPWNINPESHPKFFLIHKPYKQKQSLHMQILGSFPFQLAGHLHAIFLIRRQTHQSAPLPGAQPLAVLSLSSGRALSVLCLYSCHLPPLFLQNNSYLVSCLPDPPAHEHTPPSRTLQYLSELSAGQRNSKHLECSP